MTSKPSYDDRQAAAPLVRCPACGTLAYMTHGGPVCLACGTTAVAAQNDASAPILTPFTTILADPPWQYRDRLRQSTTKRSSMDQYKTTMTVDEICALYTPSRVETEQPLPLRSAIDGKRRPRVDHSP